MKYLIVLMLLMVSCGSSNTSTGVSNANTETISGNWYNNDSNSYRNYYEVISSSFIKIHYSKNNKKYTIEGFFNIINGVLEVNPITDPCNKGKQILTFSRYNQQTIYLNGVEYVDTTIPSEQWTFWGYETECF